MKWFVTQKSINEVIWKHPDKKFLVRVFNEHKMFPISGRDWVVDRIKMPTRNVGSVTTFIKRFGSRREAVSFAEDWMRKH